jgi:protein-tyrosine-phosphatase
MAAALLRRSLADLHRASISVSSAGTCVQPGSRADTRASQLSREYGISLDSHQAQPLTPNLVEENDLILVMDYRNEAELLVRFPEATNKVFLLKAASMPHPEQSVEIPDPYFGSVADVRHCYEILKSCTGRLALTLSDLPAD